MSSARFHGESTEYLFKITGWHGRVDTNKTAMVYLPHIKLYIMQQFNEVKK